MNADQLRELTTLVLAAYPTQRQKMSEPDVMGMLAAYAAGLIDLDYEPTKAAINRILRTSRFLPSIAEIREAADVVVRGDMKTGLEAWGSVLRAMGEKGAYRTPGEDFYFIDPITARVVASMNWADLCTSGNTVADRARFVDAYDRIALQERMNTRAATGMKPTLPAASTPVAKRLESGARDGKVAEVKGVVSKFLDDLFPGFVPDPDADDIH